MHFTSLLPSFLWRFPISQPSASFLPSTFPRAHLSSSSYLSFLTSVLSHSLFNSFILFLSLFNSFVLFLALLDFSISYTHDGNSLWPYMCLPYMCLCLRTSLNSSKSILFALLWRNTPTNPAPPLDQLPEFPYLWIGNSAKFSNKKLDYLMSKWVPPSHPSLCGSIDVNTFNWVNCLQSSQS